MNSSPQTVAALVFNRTTGAVNAGYGATVALVVADQSWDVTLDPEIGGVPTEALFCADVYVEAEVAAPRVALTRITGGVLQVRVIDPATGLAASLVAGGVRVVVSRIVPA